MIAQFNNFLIKMTMKQALSASHQGACDSDVKSLLDIPSIKNQLIKISDKALAETLYEYGAWDAEELKNRPDNEERIIWIAACGITEENR